MWNTLKLCLVVLSIGHLTGSQDIPTTTSPSHTTTRTTTPTTTTTTTPAPTTTTAHTTTTTTTTSAPTTTTTTTPAPTTTTTTHAPSTTTTTAASTTTTTTKAAPDTTTLGPPGPGDVTFTCSVNTDCTAINSDCRNGAVCECVAGYSYHADTKSCVTSTDGDLTGEEEDVLMEECMERINESASDIQEWCEDFKDWPVEVRLILVTMHGKIGNEEFKKFKKLREALKNKNWVKGGDAIKSSKWYKRDTECADKLVKRMQDVAIAEIGDKLKARMKEDLVRDEGRVLKIYKDTKGLPTFGIGHLVKKGDPEFGQPVGTKVTAERVDSVFEKDFAQAVKDAVRYCPDFKLLPDKVKRILVNMSFQMSLTRLNKFKKLRAALKNRNWKKAAEEMAKSKWAKKDSPNRAKRLIELMMEVAEEEKGAED